MDPQINRRPHTHTLESCSIHIAHTTRRLSTGAGQASFWPVPLYKKGMVDKLKRKTKKNKTKCNRLWHDSNSSISQTTSLEPPTYALEEIILLTQYLGSI